MEETHDARAADETARQAELHALERPAILAGAMTPWGIAQSSRKFADEIVHHTTAGHGGFHLASNANTVVDPAYRNGCRWYEEDCEWGKVAHAFKHLFTALERRCADRMLRDC